MTKIVASGRTAGALVSDADVEEHLVIGVRFLMVGWQAWAAAGSKRFLDTVAATTG